MGGPARTIVRLLSKGVNIAVLVVLVVLFALGCYALWDSHAVDTQADSTAWQPYKPVEPELKSYGELVRINPEVRGWVTVYGTHIDYPVCQSSDINKYLTIDAKGDYALSGSLFMEPDAAPDFTDFATFIYGHHMEHDVMFGQVSDFEQQAFFDEHRYGNLFDGTRNFGIEFFACVKADAYDGSIYRTGFASEEDEAAYVRLLMERATCSRNVPVGAGERIVLLSTCSQESTNGRTILAGVVRDQVYEDTFVTWPNLGTGVDGMIGWFGLPWYAWVLLVVLAVLIAVLAKSRHRANKKRKAAEEAAKPRE